MHAPQDDNRQLPVRGDTLDVLSQLKPDFEGDGTSCACLRVLLHAHRQAIAGET